MIDKDKYFKFYNSCIPVKGFNRTAICDLQRSEIFFISNSVTDMLQDNIDKKIEVIYEEYSGYEELVTKNFTFLIENELGFLTDEPDNFLDLDLEKDYLFLSDIMFLEIDDLQEFKVRLLKEIDSLGCVQLVLLSKSKIKFDILEQVLEILKNSKLNVISVVSEYSNDSLNIEKFFAEFPRLRDVNFFNSPEGMVSDNQWINFYSGNYNEFLSRRISSVNNLLLNLDAFIEAQKFNLFFNRKVYISNKGDIKNYFNDEKVFGNIENDAITEIISTDSFQELWKANKDKIDVCSVCEFRYICPDNRIPIQKDEKYFHESLCNYDPKTNTWK